jgi:hypothetical protein
MLRQGFAGFYEQAWVVPAGDSDFDFDVFVG